MRTEAGKMPESLTFPIKNGLGASNDRFGINAFLSIERRLLCCEPCPAESPMDLSKDRIDERFAAGMFFEEN